MASESKNWANAYILDPLTAPQPADETGPGTHFRPPPESTEDLRSVTPPRPSKNPFRQGHGTPQLTSGYPSPPQSASPRKSPSTHRQEAFAEPARHRRSSSLSERFPGDTSHRPLEQLAKEKARADRSRHVVKKHHIQPDAVDKLDLAAAGGAYHHGGPYDATLYARNNSYNSSPVAAVASTNQEALKATPHERIVDSVRDHRPLDGVAAYASGDQDRDGHVYKYEPGENMMIDNDPPGGAYKRWPGVTYHPDDIKGKGEPSYTIEEALKKKPGQHGLGADAVEMQPTHTGNGSKNPLREAFDESDNNVRRSGSFGRKIGDGLKKRIGSIKRHSRHED